MVNRKISPDMKKRAVELLTEGWSVEQVAGILNVPGKSINRWEENIERTGRVDPPSVYKGRQRLLNPAIVDDLRELILESPSLFLDEIREYLALFHDVRISTTALHRNLQDLGLTYKLLQKTAAERNEDVRTAWRRDVMTHITAEQIVTIDESSKDGRTIFRKYGRAPRGQRPVEVIPSRRSMRYSILPALSLDGYIALRVVEGAVDSIEFYDFIVNDVLPKMNRNTIASLLYDSDQYENVSRCRKLEARKHL